MGLASLWLFIWVKDSLLPFMSEQLPSAFVRCEVLCAPGPQGGERVLLLWREPRAGRSAGPSLGLPPGATSAL